MSQQKRRFEASATPSVPKTKPLSAPGREWGTALRRQQQHRLYEVRIESFGWLSRE
jgi:hypothetical protein